MIVLCKSVQVAIDCAFISTTDVSEYSVSKHSYLPTLTFFPFPVPESWRALGLADDRNALFKAGPQLLTFSQQL